MQITLPGPDETMRSATFTHDAGIDPGGTAFHASVVVAVEIPLPWPKPVFAHDLARALPDVAAAAPEPARILAEVPPADAAAEHIGVAVARIGRPVTQWYLRAGSADELAEGVAALLRDERPPNAGRAELDLPELWLCTQGSHDVCCGTEGTRLAEHLRRRRPALRVRRVSHTGGHRFAPTGFEPMTHRMWSRLDEALVDRIVERAATPSDAARCRGWSGASGGPAQVAERALLAEHGAGWEPIAIEPTGDAWLVSGAVDGEPARYRVTVGERRTVPTIACRAPGGEPVKTAIEYGVDEVVRLP